MDIIKTEKKRTTEEGTFIDITIRLYPIDYDTINLDYPESPQTINFIKNLGNKILEIIKIYRR